jgi:excisionase family DNA binding protein
MTIHHSAQPETQGKSGPLRTDFADKGEHVAMRRSARVRENLTVNPAKNQSMSDPFEDLNPARREELVPDQHSRISVPDIARRLNIGRQAVYSMLEQGFIPGIRLGRRWIVTRHAYEQWERTCGMRPGLDFTGNQR